MNDDQNVREIYFFSPKIEVLQVKANLYLNLPVYSLICM